MAHMDLKSFIKESLIQIIDGTSEAASYAETKGALVNPPMATLKLTRPVARTQETIQAPDPALVKSLAIYTTQENRLVDMIEFDVAITASTSAEESSSSGAKGGGALRLHIVTADVSGGFGSAATVARTDTRVSRLKFRVPLALPSQER